MLGYIQPMSSPMMKRKLGLASVGAGAVIFSCATAGVVIPTEAKATGRAAAKTVVARAQWSFALLLRCSDEGIWIAVMACLLSQRPPPSEIQRLIRTLSQSRRHVAAH